MDGSEGWGYPSSPAPPPPPRRTLTSASSVGLSALLTPAKPHRAWDASRAGRSADARACRQGGGGEGAEKGGQGLREKVGFSVQYWPASCLPSLYVCSAGSDEPFTTIKALWIRVLGA